jgi:RNA polymerase sigma factor (sigma-70 family)
LASPRVADTWEVTDLAASSSAPPAHARPLRLLSDERLARLVAADSDRAFAVLYQRHHQALYRYCLTIVRHEQDAQDVLQTTMARALAALGRATPDAPMRPWLFRIAHNEAVSVLRRRRPTVELDQATEPATPPLEARVDERNRLNALVADLNELPERQRAALVMRELSGLSHEEIAAALGVSLAAAKQAIFDARTGLAEFARGRAMECADVERIISERDGRMLRGRPLRAHLRGCASCRALRDAIAGRRADLAALAPPLPAAAATGLLASIVGGGGHGGGAGGITSTIAGKIGAGAFGAKALAGAAVVATVAVGGAQVLPHRSSRDGSSPARSTARAASPAAASGSAPAVGTGLADPRAPHAIGGASAPAEAPRRASGRHATADPRPARHSSGQASMDRAPATPRPADGDVAAQPAASHSGSAAASHGARAHRPAAPKPARHQTKRPAARPERASRAPRPVGRAERPSRATRQGSGPATRPSRPAPPRPASRSPHPAPPPAHIAPGAPSGGGGAGAAAPPVTPRPDAGPSAGAPAGSAHFAAPPAAVPAGSPGGPGAGAPPAKSAPR